MILRELRDGRSTEQVVQALSEGILALPNAAMRTLTWDQGKEFVAHAMFNVATANPVYFCDPHSPWQRDSDENTNGMLRQHFPKGIDLSVYTQADFDDVGDQLNTRPCRPSAGRHRPRCTLKKQVLPSPHETAENWVIARGVCRRRCHEIFIVAI